MAALFAVGAASLTLHAQPPVQPWQTGDVFVGIGNIEYPPPTFLSQITNPGVYVVYDSQGHPTGETLTDASLQQTAGCAVDPNGNLWTTGWYTSKVTQFSAATHGVASVVDASPYTVPSGVTDVSLDTGEPAGVESVIFDKSGHMFIGTVDGMDPIVEYTLNASGVGVDPASAVIYYPPPDNRGTDWLDLAADQNTMFYTSESNQINAFTLDGSDLPAGVSPHIVIQYLDHVDPVTGPVWAPVGNTAFAFRLLPPGDAVTGGFVVATEAGFYRIDVNGHITRGFAAPDGAVNYFSLDLTADGRSMWGGTLSDNSSAPASRLYKFHLPTAVKTVGPLTPAGTHFLNGVCVMKEYTAGLTQPDCSANPSDPLCSPVPDCSAVTPTGDCAVPGAPIFDPANPLTNQTSAEGATASYHVPGVSTTGSPLSYSATGRPSWLALDPDTGILSGTPPFDAAAWSPYAIQVTVTDTSNTLTVTRLLYWTVTDVNVAPSLNPIPDQTTSHNVTVSFPVHGTDFDSVRAPCDLVSFAVVSVVPIGATPASPLPTLTAVNVPSEQSDHSCSIATFHATLTGSSSVDGSYTVTVVASDTKPVPGTDTRAFTWTVANHPPTIVAQASRSTHAGASIASFTVGASDADGDSLTFSDIPTGTAHTLPPGVTITSAGVVSGSPQVVGTYPVTLVVNDGHGGVATTAFTWSVTNVAPAFVNPPASEFSIPNAPVSVQLAATDSDLDPLTFGAAGLPNGLSISPNGLISGTPTVTGVFPVTLTVSDPWGGTATRSLTWTVSTNRPPLCVPATASPSLLWPPDHKFVPIAITGVSDPDGNPVTLAVTRIIQDERTSSGRDSDDDHDRGDDGRGSGNTAIDGIGAGSPQASVRAERDGTGDGRVYEIRFTATDSLGASCSGAVFVGVPHDRHDTPVDSQVRYDSTVAGGPPLSGPEFNKPPVIANPTVDTTIAGHATSVSVTATDVNLDPLAFSDLVGSSHSLPSGLTIDAQTGLISGAATAEGTFPVTLTVSDPFGGVAATSFNWTVRADRAPIARHDAATTLKGTAVTIAVLANDTDPDRDPLTVTSVTAPAHGTAVIRSNGSIVYTPTSGYAGADTFAYVVSDGFGRTATATVTVTITPHYAGDGCDRERGKGGHSAGGDDDHDRDVPAHYTGDGDDHDRGRHGHHAGDGCEHDLYLRRR